jgi:hypothetical protein
MIFDMFPNGSKDGTVPSFVRSLVIANSGNVAIRTTPANASLYVIKAGSFEGSAVFGGTNHHSYFHYSSTEDTYIRAGKFGSHVYINDIPAGKIIMGAGYNLVGINTSTPSSPLDVRQTGLTGIIQIEPNNGGNNWEQVVGLYSGGPHSSLKLLYNGLLKCFFRPTDGEFVTSSDSRLKTNIQSFNAILNRFMQLRPVEYEISNNNPHHQKTIGFIAQEVRQLFPDLVSISKDSLITGTSLPDFHSLNYNGFKVLAIQAVQEEQVLISDLQQRETEMLRRMDMIEKQLSIKN